MKNVGGIILAGGQARRMGGGDKCLSLIGKRTLLSIIIERAQDQVSSLILNANGDPNRFAVYSLPVLKDVIGGFYGPLAGILTGMEWLKDNKPRATWLVSFAGDAPFIPRNFVQTCLQNNQISDIEIICGRSSGRAHPVCSLWRVSLASELRKAIEEDEIRKIDAWTSNYSVYYQDFDADPIDPFFNINSENDLIVANTNIDHID